ncbi:MAG: amylo-alpha-1,6-glucosidase [Chloroflexi bacterium]|nr:amylo-alpha-1,6-glucosidase [Chloroflexota bacterium]
MSLLSLPISVGPSTITINRDDRFVVCQPDGRIDPNADEGFFARDTRFVSGYQLWLNGKRPVLLNSAPVRFFSSRFEFTNPAVLDSDGEIPLNTLQLRLDRTISGGVHEDYDLVNYARRPVALTLEVEIDSDFADIFDVKDHSLVRRGSLNSRWYRTAGELRTSYVNRDFRRQLVVAIERADSPAQFANGRIVFLVRLAPKEVWHTCIRWLPVSREGRRPPTLGCHALTESRAGLAPPRLPRVAIDTPNETVRRAWEQAVRDMESLRLEDPAFGRGVFIASAGIPWFVTLFGRDALVVAMQGISGYPEFAAGALRRLSELQADENDPERDMEPGKIPHEVRHGELTQLGLLPFAPYYGTHDATSLFVIVLSYLYRWTGDRSILERYLPHAEAAMRWIDRYGDRDNDGFQEYGTRSSHGYFNQGWKDAGDGIPEADGSQPPLPMALCEHQGYAYDAKLRLADVYVELGRDGDAERLRREAAELFQRFNDRFWWEGEGTYYLGLNGRKKPIRSVASNAGHLLASGIVPAERAGKVVRRLLADDMWSGWGIRTLSSDHPAYNPFSYHTGSVWPHDNAIIAGGFRRYGFDAESAQVARGLFDAAACFAANRLPELFAGLPRDEGTFPVQYLAANVPQAWAATAVFRLVAILCGIHAAYGRDGGRLHVNPALPDWLNELTISNLRVGKGSVALAFRGDEVEELRNNSGYRLARSPAPHPMPAPWAERKRRAASA